MDLHGWQDVLTTINPVWKPHALNHDQWPPDYQGVWNWRIKTLLQLADNETLQRSAKAYYSTRPVEFIMHWMDTYDPRRSPDHDDPKLRGSKWIPFVFFEKQADFITFLHELRNTSENGLAEKSRDMGASWGACGYSVWSWLFIEADAIGWGSRKQDLVDTLGDPDSLFEKMRLLINRLPAFFLPDGFTPKKHATFMKLINPENGATITGEAGDNIGRGGRKSMYFKDEAAHYERPEKIEAALGDNTNVQIDISSVNGLGNVFHRRRENGVDWKPGAVIEKGFVRVFVMDWKDHPNKTQEWYDQRKAKYEREGMAHVFAQEVDRNYSAAISNTVIPYEWIQASVDAHLVVPYLRMHPDNIPNIWMGGLDVADGGKDRNALSMKQWIIWRHCEEWGERDPGVTARRAIMACRASHKNIIMQYDSIGVGSGVKTEYNRLVQDEKFDNIPAFVAWNAGAGVLLPYERIIPDDDNAMINKDFYANLKAQAWWSLRTRFYKTWKAVTQGIVYQADEMISLDSSMELIEQLMKELAQATYGPSAGLKTMINKTPEGTKSPNLADSGVMMYFPIPDDYGQINVGNYGH